MLVSGLAGYVACKILYLVSMKHLLNVLRVYLAVFFSMKFCVAIVWCFACCACQKLAFERVRRKSRSVVLWCNRFHFVSAKSQTHGYDNEVLRVTVICLKWIEISFAGIFTNFTRCPPLMPKAFFELRICSKLNKRLTF